MLLLLMMMKVLLDVHVYGIGRATWCPPHEQRRVILWCYGLQLGRMGCAAFVGYGCRLRVRTRPCGVPYTSDDECVPFYDDAL